MSETEGNRQEAALRIWLPAILKLLVLIIFAFVLYEATVGLGSAELSSSRVQVIIAGMLGLLLLLAIDRLTELSMSGSGFTATLSEAKVRALQQVETLDNRQVAEVTRAKIMAASSPAEVQGALSLAQELNVTRIVDQITQAIAEKRRLHVYYRPTPTAPEEVHLVAPLDIKPGKTPDTATRDYLWAYDFTGDHVVSFRLDRVPRVELSEETFDPAAIMKDWKDRTPQWNVPRDW